MSKVDDNFTSFKTFKFISFVAVDYYLSLQGRDTRFVILAYLPFVDPFCIIKFVHRIVINFIYFFIFYVYYFFKTISLFYLSCLTSIEKTVANREEVTRRT